MPRTEFDRCSGAGGSYDGTSCRNSYGEKVVL